MQDYRINFFLCKNFISLLKGPKVVKYHMIANYFVFETFLCGFFVILHVNHILNGNKNIWFITYLKICIVAQINNSLCIINTYTGRSQFSEGRSQYKLELGAERYACRNMFGFGYSQNLVSELSFICQNPKSET